MSGTGSSAGTVKPVTQDQIAGLIRGLDNAADYCGRTQAYDSQWTICETAAALYLLDAQRESMTQALDALAAERDALAKQLANALAHTKLDMEMLTATQSSEERLKQRITELEPAAECWDAIAKCYRITCMGSAGLHPDSPHHSDGSGYAHATFNLWTAKKAPEGATGDAQDLRGRELLGEFVQIAMKNAALSTHPSAREQGEAQK